MVFCREEYRVPAGARLVVDIGANVGTFSLYAASAVPVVRVIAVEPYPSTFAKLVRQVERNGLSDRIDCWRVALAAHDGVRCMDGGEELPSQSRGFTTGATGDGAVLEVETISAGGLLEKAARIAPIDFLKIDIEGAEHEVFPAIPQGGLDPVRSIGIEYHPCGDKSVLFGDIEGHGFKCTLDRPFAPNFGVAHFART